MLKNAELKLQLMNKFYAYIHKKTYGSTKKGKTEKYITLSNLSRSLNKA